MGSPQSTIRLKYCGNILLYGDKMQKNYAYLAGLLDGEGCIGIYNEKNGKGNPRRMRVRMVISSTTLELMDFLKKEFDVHYVQKRSLNGHFGKKPIYHANFNEHQILAYGELMLPFLIIKHDRMEEAIKFLKTKNLRDKGKWKK